MLKDGWLVKHKQVSGNIPVPHGHTPAWTHGFNTGYIAPKDTGYTDGWLVGRNAFLIGAPNNINDTSHTQNYKDGFNNSYHANKDPLAGWLAFPLHSVTYTDCDDD